MSDAYDIRLQSGAGAVNIYHGAANATDGADDDSLGSITQSLTNMHMAHNANAQQVADTMSQITTETRELRAMMQQFAAMAQATVAAPPA